MAIDLMSPMPLCSGKCSALPDAHSLIADLQREQDPDHREVQGVTPSRRLEFPAVKEAVARSGISTDYEGLRRIYEFLDAWGLINYEASDGAGAQPGLTASCCSCLRCATLPGSCFLVLLQGTALYSAWRCMGWHFEVPYFVETPCPVHLWVVAHDQLQEAASQAEAHCVA